MIRLALLLSMLALISNAAFADEIQERAAAPTVTFEQLFKSPGDYANKFVRIRGQVDNCFSMTCNLCPENMTAETFDRFKCLGLEFDGYGDGRSGNRTALLMEQAFRFAIVTINVKFDPTCLYSMLPNRNPKTVPICLDRQTILESARVETVHARKSALDGIVSWYDFGPLREPDSEAERLALLNGFKEALSPNSSADIRVFLMDGKGIPRPEDVEALGLGCICTERSCEGNWPKRWFLGFDSPANPVECQSMEKVKGTWHLAQ
jgi:hypothetical protein